MRPRRLSEAGRAEIESVAVKRMEMPSDKELAERWGISRTWVQTLMQAARGRFLGKTQVTDIVPRETENQQLVGITALSDEAAP